MVTANVALTGNLSAGHMSSSISEFEVLKQFHINTHCCPAPVIKQINWHPPPCYWVKCNTDGAFRGSPRISGCGGLFRDYRASILGCFSKNLGVSTSLIAELEGAMLAIEIAFEKGWHRLWLEYDSQLVVMAFNNVKLVPWKVRTRWRNCLYKYLSIRKNRIRIFFSSGYS